MPIVTILDLVQDHRSDISGIVPHTFEKSEVVAADNPEAVKLVVEGHGVYLAIMSEFALGEIVFARFVDKYVAAPELEFWFSVEGGVKRGRILTGRIESHAALLLGDGKPVKV